MEYQIHEIPQESFDNVRNNVNMSSKIEYNLQNFRKRQNKHNIIAIRINSEQPSMTVAEKRTEWWDYKSKLLHIRLKSCPNTS